MRKFAEADIRSHGHIDTGNTHLAFVDNEEVVAPAALSDDVLVLMEEILQEIPLLIGQQYIWRQLNSLLQKTI